MTGSKIVELRDVCKQDRKSIRSGERKDLRYIGMESIESNTGAFVEGVLSKTPEEPQANSFHFNNQHVLYGKLRPYLNKVALPQFEGKCSTEVIPLLPSDQVDRSYLAYFLRSAQTVARISAKTAGARMPRADMDFVLGLQLPLPPINEQRRIVDLLSRAEGIVRLRREAQRKAAELVPGVFLNMFGDPATNPKGFEHVTLGELIKVKSGEFLPAEKMDQSGDIPVYGGNGINGRHSVAMFEETQVVIGRVGAYCGNVHLTESRSWVTDNALYVASRYRPVSNHFLVCALRASRLNQYASQAGQPLISAGRIYPAKIQLPPFDLQQQFDQHCRDIFGLCIQQSAATAKAEATFNALLGQAFPAN